jgi:hypothetical protein
VIKDGRAIGHGTVLDQHCMFSSVSRFTKSAVKSIVSCYNALEFRVRVSQPTKLSTKLATRPDGATDEIGATVAEDGVHVHDFHATILHLLGIDHTRLTYRYAGHFRLTDVAGRVVKPILS